ncbi:hypothetical protein V8G54_004470 [Vigna mungo]|uniref:Uncharacterized protein n=1 Tax=Vigna mungo TaxID=3915 RepID=A0AAQ3PDI1_VIGMU
MNIATSISFIHVNVIVGAIWVVGVVDITIKSTSTTGVIAVIMISDTLRRICICILICIFPLIQSSPKGVLVVVHPHLEDPSRDPNVIAELLDQSIIPFLHSPPQFLREVLHLLLLLLAELGPVPLLRVLALQHHARKG